MLPACGNGRCTDPVLRRRQQHACEILIDAVAGDPVHYSSTVAAPNSWSLASSSLAFDASGSLYTSFTTGSGAFIASLPGQCNATFFTAYSPTLPGAARLQFNANNNLVVEVYRTQTQNWIATYGHPSGGRLGKLIGETPLAKMNGQTSELLTLSSDGETLWASSFTQNGVGQFKYPAGGNPIDILNVGRVAGGAVYPQLVP